MHRERRCPFVANNRSRALRQPRIDLMSLSEIFSSLKRYEEDAAVIFDRDEPVGRPTDLVMPRRRWFGHARRKQFKTGEATPKQS
jgi:hypothetical protein